MTLYTEKEAADKWCPLARRAPGGDNCDADGRRRFTARCIGSLCMAWRFGREMTAEQIAILWSEKTLTRVGTKVSEKGYCGAFGKVEP